MELVGKLLAKLDLLVRLLSLQETVEGRDELVVEMVRGEARLGPQVDVVLVATRQRGQEASLSFGRRRVHEALVEILHDDGALSEPLYLALLILEAQAWDEAFGVDFEENLWLLVRVNFDVAVGDAQVFERHPSSVHKGAEGCAKDGEPIVWQCRVSLDGLEGLTSASAVVARSRLGHGGRWWMSGQEALLAARLHTAKDCQIRSGAAACACSSGASMASKSSAGSQ